MATWALSLAASIVLALSGAGVASASTPPAGVHVLGGGFDSPDAIATDCTHVWVTNPANNTLSELNAATGRYMRTLLGPAYGFHQPDAVVVDVPDV